MDDAIYYQDGLLGIHYTLAKRLNLNQIIRFPISIYGRSVPLAMKLFTLWSPISKNDAHDLAGKMVGKNASASGTFMIQVLDAFSAIAPEQIKGGAKLCRELHSSVMGTFCENKSWLCLLSAVFFFVTIYSACISDQPLSQSAATFREETLEGFEGLTLKLAPALERDSQFGAAGEVIKDYLLDQCVNGRYVLGLSVLDPSGNYLVGYRIGDTAPGSIEKTGYEDMSFASFKGVDRVVSSRKIVQMPLFFQEHSVLVVGAPLVKEDRLLGIMCLSFDKERFEKEWEISEQEFLKIDFNVK